MTHMFRIPAETAARFTWTQRQFMTQHTISTHDGLLVDLEQMNIDELYNLDRILTWTEKNWRENNYHAEQPASEK